ncbi:hypothetical protein KRR38_28275 [Novosphingobium sp. G106]|uniref:hypothetical protein n=1 Tax=Novosphingobium sp. G106 TaxID=2849500 RepID=UPI001C2D0CCC|nr:hypothetical protein [Novosphingobium sp. G106]MBV1691475.1 hypothetical protein [Novosphingobium sp. G106]
MDADFINVGEEQFSLPERSRTATFTARALKRDWRGRIARGTSVQVRADVAFKQVRPSDDPAMIANGPSGYISCANQAGRTVIPGSAGDVSGGSFPIRCKLARE